MDKWGNSSLGRYSFGATQDLSDTSILIVVGSLSISGGTNLIFEYANAIQNSGANVTIAYLLGEAGDANWHPHSSKFTYEKITSVYDQYFDLVIVI